MSNYSWVFSAVTALVAIVIMILTYSKSTRESGKWEGSVTAKIEEFDKFMQEVRSDIGKIRDDIGKIFQALPPDTVKRTSPLQLTDLGEKVSEEIQASGWAKRIAPNLVAQVKEKGPYDIQEFCLAYVKREDVLSEEMQKKVKTSAYENGIKKEQVLRVLAVELRNLLLPE